MTMGSSSGAPPSRTIEVTVISAEGLLVNRKRPVKNTVSVTVRTSPFHSGSTGVDPEGRSCPSWNERLVMELPAHTPFLTVEARAGSRVVGAASIPVTDFAGVHLPDGYLSFVSYRLRDASGEKNGIVNLSVRVRGGGSSSCAASCSRPWMGVAAAEGGAVVMGVPVSYTY
ncbi:BON1-associated protein 2-like [Salvia miltiorrhiza]|uniref:BON1-associated protein 2-like n=1 Tax=Salvia miltiorrhiza TaxID=226208 RepID=UPI0025AC12FA|nr:BON1-associated protein 2-like [Salvia miltiorrhiza]